MMHCHILDHAEGGLMGMVHLSPRSGDSPPSPVHNHHESHGH
jgi:hypothetical protein